MFTSLSNYAKSLGRMQITFLSRFGRKAGQGRRDYRRYVGEGINQGPRPELVGGGLVRSLGGWSAVKCLRRSGERVLTDERILGTDDFVGRVLGEADHRSRHLFSSFFDRQTGSGNYWNEL